MSNKAVTVSRSRVAWTAAAPPCSLAASQRRCRPDRCQAAHSVWRGSWPPRLPERWQRAAAVSTARTRRSARDPGPDGGASPPSTSTSRSPNFLEVWPGRARCRVRRSWRSDTGSTPPIGPVSRSSAWSPSSPSAVASSTVSSARTAGSADNGPPTAGGATGTPAAARARGNRTARGTDLTITAICDQGTPSIRCARRSASAIIAASACAEPARRTSPIRPRSRCPRFADRRFDPVAVVRCR